MRSTIYAPLVNPGLGDDVAKEVLQWIGAFRSLYKATIISFNMQDYDFWGNGFLSSLLLRQIANGAQITVMTTPPPGNNGRKATFRNKLRLLEELNNNGVDVYVHPYLHAKAYLFQDVNSAEMVIVGSPNLTNGGFGTGGSAGPDFLELALMTEDTRVYSSTVKVIVTDLIGDAGTLHFATWVSNNLSAISDAKGAP